MNMQGKKPHPVTHSPSPCGWHDALPVLEGFGRSGISPVRSGWAENFTDQLCPGRI